MSADVWVLANTADPLYAYPSALHEGGEEPDGLWGYAYDPKRPIIQLEIQRKRRSDEAALAALGVI